MAPKPAHVEAKILEAADQDIIMSIGPGNQCLTLTGIGYSGQRRSIRIRTNDGPETGALSGNNEMTLSVDLAILRVWNMAGMSFKRHTWDHRVRSMVNTGTSAGMAKVPSMMEPSPSERRAKSRNT